jgi:hypothetical protein
MLKKPAVYSLKVETGQRQHLLRVKSIIEVLFVLARHIFTGASHCELETFRLIFSGVVFEDNI